MLWPRCLFNLFTALLLVLSLGVCHAESKKPVKKTVHSTGKTSVHHTSATAHSRTRRGKIVPASDKKKKSTRSRSHRRKASWRTRGQQKIDPARTRDIQEALIREHYLDGKPSGKWDEASQKAMRRYQSDNGWQSVTTPDSRALIKLGLGPDHAHLLNPDSAMTSSLAPAHAEEQTQKAAAVAVPSIDGTGPSSNEKPTVVGDPVPVNGPPRQ